MRPVRSVFAPLHLTAVTLYSGGTLGVYLLRKHMVRWLGGLKDVARNVDVRSHLLEKRAVPYSLVPAVKSLICEDRAQAGFCSPLPIIDRSRIPTTTEYKNAQPHLQALHAALWQAACRAVSPHTMAGAPRD